MSKPDIHAISELPIAIIDGDRGVNYPKKSEFTKSGHCVFLNTGNVGQRGFSFSEVDFITKEQDDKLRKGKLERNDVVLTTRGTVGNSAYYNDDIPFENIRINSGMVILRTSHSRILPYYLYLYFRSSIFKHQVTQQVSGSAQPQLPINALRNFGFPMVSLERQHKIVSVLSSLDSKIALNTSINAELEGLAKTIYDYWFVQFDFPISAAYAASVGQPQLEGRPYKSSGGEMVWDERLKREVPEGWENYSLSEIGDIIGGSTPSKAKKEYFTAGGSGIPWITPKDLSSRKGKRFISHGEFDVTEAGRKSASLKIMPKGTVLLSSRAPVGYMAIAREPVTTNQGFKSLVPKDGFSTEYVFLTVQLYLPAIIKKASGSTFAEISSSTLKTVEIAAPPQELIEKFTATVSPMFAQQDVLEKENQELASLRDWLLPMLMNGQVKVGEAKEYVQEGEVGMAAEEQNKYN